MGSTRCKTRLPAAIWASGAAATAGSFPSGLAPRSQRHAIAAGMCGSFADGAGWGGGREKHRLSLGKMNSSPESLSLARVSKIGISFRLSMPRCKKSPFIPQGSSRHTLISTPPPPDIWTHKDLRFGGFKSSSTRFTHPETFGFPNGPVASQVCHLRSEHPL